MEAECGMTEILMEVGMRDKNNLPVAKFTILAGGIYSFEIDRGMQDENAEKIAPNVTNVTWSGIIILNETRWRDCPKIGSRMRDRRCQKDRKSRQESRA